MFEELSPPYGTIVVDPPWGYDKKGGAPWRSTSTPTYSLMSIDAIKALPIRELSTPDAHLYLWAVLPMMAEAVDVVRAWGFELDTVLTWCKPGPGLGGGWRGNTEHLLVARRGFSYINPTCARCGGRARGAVKCACSDPDWRHDGERVTDGPRRSFSSTAAGTWHVAPRGAHSEKPALFGDLIESMSPGPYLELFARAPRLGWDAWGKGFEGVVQSDADTDTNGEVLWPSFPPRSSLPPVS